MRIYAAVAPVWWDVPGRAACWPCNISLKGSESIKLLPQTDAPVAPFVPLVPLRPCKYSAGVVLREGVTFKLDVHGQSFHVRLENSCGLDTSKIQIHGNTGCLRVPVRSHSVPSRARQSRPEGDHLFLTMPDPGLPNPRSRKRGLRSGLPVLHSEKQLAGTQLCWLAVRLQYGPTAFRRGLVAYFVRCTHHASRYGFCLAGAERTRQQESHSWPVLTISCAGHG